MSDFIKDIADKLANRVLFDYLPKADKVLTYNDLVTLISEAIEQATEHKHQQALVFKQAFDQLLEAKQANKCAYCCGVLAQTNQPQ